MEIRISAGRAVAVIAFGLLSAGCAGTGSDHVPILDGPPSRGYATDLAACQALARDQRQFDQETAAAAVLGAGVGSLVGLADDGMSDSEGMIAGAVGGALVGGIAGLVEATEHREAIVVACVRGRGHRVVG